MRGFKLAERILKDDLQVAAMPAHGAGVAGQKVLAAPDDGAAGRRYQPQDGARQRGFAGARFADQANGLAARHIEAHRIERRARAEIDAEVPNLKDRIVHGSSGWWHASALAGSMPRNSGRSARHRSLARGQRGAKAQPPEGVAPVGGCPGNEGMRAARGARKFGTHLRSSAV